jgi:hypothetical protein
MLPPWCDKESTKVQSIYVAPRGPPEPSEAGLASGARDSCARDAQLTGSDRDTCGDCARARVPWCTRGRCHARRPRSIALDDLSRRCDRARARRAPRDRHELAHDAAPAWSDTSPRCTARARGRAASCCRPRASSRRLTGTAPVDVVRVATVVVVIAASSLCWTPIELNESIRAPSTGSGVGTARIRGPSLRIPLGASRRLDGRRGDLIGRFLRRRDPRRLLACGQARAARSTWPARAWERSSSRWAPPIHSA